MLTANYFNNPNFLFIFISFIIPLIYHLTPLNKKIKSKRSQIIKSLVTILKCFFNFYYELFVELNPLIVIAYDVDFSWQKYINVLLLSFYDSETQESVVVKPRKIFAGAKENIFASLLFVFSSCLRHFSNEIFYICNVCFTKTAHKFF